MIPILILAAGQSSRMRGVDKVLMDVDGQPLLARQISMAAEVGEVFVAVSPDQTARAELVKNSPATLLTTSFASEGIGGTLRSAVPQMPHRGQFMVLLTDLMLLESSDLRCVVKAVDQHPNNLIWRGATPNGDAGHPIILDDSLRPAFGALRGDRGANQIAKAHRAQTHFHRFNDDRALFDLDTPEDWATWCASR